MAESDDEDDSDEADFERRQTQAVKDRYSKDRENVPAENGVIESVHCFNFMCHKNWELKLNPLINFVIGKNGSGKSAALTALILCLGGKASATNRATNLKGFISEGQE
jgi:predicted ATPase